MSDIRKYISIVEAMNEDIAEFGTLYSKLKSQSLTGTLDFNSSEFTSLSVSQQEALEKSYWEAKHPAPEGLYDSVPYMKNFASKDEFRAAYAVWHKKYEAWKAPFHAFKKERDANRERLKRQQQSAYYAAKYPAGRHATVIGSVGLPHFAQDSEAELADQNAMLAQKHHRENPPRGWKPHMAKGESDGWWMSGKGYEPPGGSVATAKPSIRKFSK